VRPTVFLEGFFLLFAAASVRDADELALPLGASKTSPVSSVDVARAVAASRGGALASRTRVMDRDADRYVETVTMRETGEVLHRCDEPLSEHQGHGSARPRR
jgi:hypothetical protein